MFKTVIHSFCHELAQMCMTFGMAFNPRPFLLVLSGLPDQVERVLKAWFHDVMTKLQLHKELDLLIVTTDYRQRRNSADLLGGGDGEDIVVHIAVVPGDAHVGKPNTGAGGCADRAGVFDEAAASPAAGVCQVKKKFELYRSSPECGSSTIDADDGVLLYS